MAKNKKVDLSFELTELSQAVEGARILLDAVQLEQLRNQDQMRSAPAAASSVLSLVSTRLQSICKVLRRHSDPKSIWTPENAAASAAASRSVQLTSWTLAQVATHAQAEWERATARLRHPKAKKLARRPGGK
jgi:hypothetical protein